MNRYYGDEAFPRSNEFIRSDAVAPARKRMNSLLRGTKRFNVVTNLFVLTRSPSPETNEFVTTGAYSDRLLCELVY